ncbi:hypothetical protein AB0H73_09670 [Streptomyces olivoreticuli]
MIDVTAELGGPGLAVVPAAEIAGRMGLSVGTISGAPGFLTQAGLFQPGRMAWALTEAGLSLARLRREGPARARLLLREHWQGMWFQRAAVRGLQGGPVEEAELARQLGQGVPGGPERALYLVEWLAYARIVHCGEDGLVALSAGTGPAAGGPAPASDGPEPGSWTFLDPLMDGPAEKVSALPDDRFVALMNGYRAILLSLTPGTAGS